MLENYLNREHNECKLYSIHQYIYESKEMDGSTKEKDTYTHTLPARASRHKKAHCTQFVDISQAYLAIFQ